MGGGRGKGQGKGKARRSFEEDPVPCEKKMVNCLRHGTLGMRGCFFQGGYLPVADRHFSSKVTACKLQAAQHVVQSMLLSFFVS